MACVCQLVSFYERDSRAARVCLALTSGQSPHGDPHPRWEGSSGPRCHAQSEVAGSVARALAGADVNLQSGYSRAGAGNSHPKPHAPYHQTNPLCPVLNSSPSSRSLSPYPKHHSICISASPWAASFKQLYRTRPARRPERTYFLGTRASDTTLAFLANFGIADNSGVEQHNRHPSAVKRDAAQDPRRGIHQSGVSARRLGARAA